MGVKLSVYISFSSFPLNSVVRLSFYQGVVPSLLFVYWLSVVVVASEATVNVFIHRNMNKEPAQLLLQPVNLVFGKVVISYICNYDV